MTTEKEQKPSLALRQVTIDNALTRAAQGLSLSEKRLVMCAVSRLDSRKQTTPEKMPITRVTAQEYADLAKIQMDTAYKELKSACKRLYTRSIHFYEPADPERPDSKWTEVDMRWVGKAKYRDDEGVVELYWWHELIPFLTGIESHFTNYQLQQATALRSIYSWRLLELLSQFKDKGLLIIGTDEFAHAMDATEKQRTDFGQIRKRIIEPAVKELIEKDGWDITWQAIKRGRTVATLRFDFDTHEPAKPKRTKLPAMKPASEYVDPSSQSTSYVLAPIKPRNRNLALEALGSIKHKIGK
jgi:plasmid replication initiation protein